MTDTDILIKNKKPDIKRLLSYGFVKSEKNYVYSAKVVNDQFEMTVIITKDGKLSTKIRDTLSKELYIIHKVSNSSGGFVGKVREEHDRILHDIIKNCFDNDTFKSEYSKLVIEYVRKKYYDELEFLWEKFPNNAIFRRQDSDKWYAALLILQKHKLGLKEDGIVEIIDLRIKPEDLDNLIDNKKYFPGYHMNKKHWNTVIVDGKISQHLLQRMIDESYDKVKARITKV